MFANRWVGMGCFMVAALLLLLARDPEVLAGDECPNQTPEAIICADAMPFCVITSVSDKTCTKEGARKREKGTFDKNVYRTKEGTQIVTSSTEQLCYIAYVCTFDQNKNECIPGGMVANAYIKPGYKEVPCPKAGGENPDPIMD